MQQNKNNDKPLFLLSLSSSSFFYFEILTDILSSGKFIDKRNGEWKKLTKLMLEGRSSACKRSGECSFSCKLRESLLSMSSEMRKTEKLVSLFGSRVSQRQYFFYRRREMNMQMGNQIWNQINKHATKCIKIWMVIMCAVEIQIKTFLIHISLVRLHLTRCDFIFSSIIGVTCKRNDFFHRKKKTKSKFGFRCEYFMNIFSACAHDEGFSFFIFHVCRISIREIHLWSLSQNIRKM